MKDCKMENQTAGAENAGSNGMLFPHFLVLNFQLLQIWSSHFKVDSFMPPN